MLKRLVGLMLLLIIVAAGAEMYTVEIGDNYFDPDYIEISPGDRIKWINVGSSAHRVRSDTGLFDSGRLDPGDDYIRTFNSEGSFGYYDTFFPSVTGTIEVVESAVEETSWGKIRAMYR
jgi:plastocyanin